MISSTTRPELRLYIEGGDSSEARGLLRAGFSSFLQEIAAACADARIAWNPVCAKCDGETFKAFRNSVSTRPGVWSGVLLDSDCCPEAGAADVLEFLRKGKRWDVSGIKSSQCHLMVVKMETWFLADPEAMEQHFGKGFDPGALPRPSNLELLPSRAIDEAISKAVRGTKREKYRKIQDAAKLLQLIRPERVRQRSVSCERLFKTLLEAVQTMRPIAR